MTILFLDTETYSDIPIRDGTHRYSESVEITVASYAFDDEPEAVTDLTLGQGLPSDVRDALRDPTVTIVGHNFGMFDRVVLRAAGLDIPASRIQDTMVQALAHGLPGSLERLGEIFGISEDQAKLASGKALIQLFAKPRPKNSILRRATRETHPKEWGEFLEYAKRDITAMRFLYKNLPRWNYPGDRTSNMYRGEYDNWLLDQAINDRGMCVDTDLARAAIDAVNKAQKVLDARTDEMTDGDVERTTQRDKLLQHLLSEYGVALPDMAKSTLERRLLDDNLPDAVRELIANRLESSTTSNSKYNALLRSVSRDGRLRGTLQFCGAARTGRDAGRLFQPQNLPRPDMAQHDIDAGIIALKTNTAHLLFDSPIKLASNAIRGCIVAAPGRKLVVGDFAQIEARVLPWLAGETWKLDAFRAYDAGEGPDLYKATAARVTGKPVDEITKPERQRYGKVPELACLLEGTLVLTASGEVPIEQVLPGDVVWDGFDWVRTDGAVFKGYRDAIEYDGLCATADHLVWVERQANPVEFGRAAADGLRLIRSRAPDKIATSVPRQTFDRRQRALQQSSAPRVEELRRQGHSFQLCHNCASICMGFGEPRLAPDGSGIGSDRERRALRAGESSLVIEEGKPFAHSANETRVSATSVSGTVPGCSLCRLHVAQSAERRSDVRADSLPVDAAELQTKRRVWDLLNCGPLHRFTASGRLVHNCGYGGAKGAFKSMARLLGGDDVDDAESQEIVNSWRKANVAIADWDDGLWAKLNRAAFDALHAPGQAFGVNGKMSFEKWRAWLRFTLPSGRALCYADPQIIEDPRMPGKMTLSYMGLNSYTRKWERLTTYGGKLSADGTQATARDILWDAAHRVEAAGYPIILRCHDEFVSEPLDSDKFTVTGMIAEMVKKPYWVDADLPIAADGFKGPRYRKDG